MSYIGVLDANVLVPLSPRDTVDVLSGDLLDLDPGRFVELLREQAADFFNPPMTFEELLGPPRRMVPELVATVRGRAGAK